MKLILKYLLTAYLKILVKIALLIHHPFIIAIAGSTNKTFAKEAIAKVLYNKKISFLANPKSFNTEIGLPLAILGLPSGYNSPRKWLPALYQSLFCLFKKFPKYLVLELGVSDKGDMRYLLSLIKPDISIIIDITQRYLESFSGMDELIVEYGYLIQNTKTDGLILLNNDNNRIKSLEKLANAKIITFGFDEGSTYRAYGLGKDLSGQSFNVNFQSSSKKFNIKHFGRHHIYSFLVSLIINDYVDQTKKI